jgi:hypothetical protein
MYGELNQEDVRDLMQNIVFLGNTIAMVQQNGQVVITEVTALVANNEALTKILMRHGVTARPA